MIEQNITETLESNYMPYSAHVIMERALPEIDGLKPSQRRILYTMYRMNLLKSQRKKSQSIVGQTMFLHPHGDASIYQTLVKMSTDNESLLVPYIDSKGNFGKVYSRDMKEASGRYTECKLTPVASELFKDINKDTVEMIDNYDGTLKEPRLLPVTFPSILTNPSSGMAVGMASSIASFNLSEVVDFTVAYLKNQKSDVSDYIKAPDLPTGGNIIFDKDEFKKIYDTGRGSFNIRATYKFEDNSIIFEEIPYTTTFEAIIDRITLLIRENKIKEISDINDIYGIKTKGIEIIVKRGVDKEALVQKLFKMTPLQSSFGCNFNVVVDGTPKVLGIKGIIHEWIKFRANTIKNGILSEVKKKKDYGHLLSALKKVLLDIDKAISIIRETEKNADIILNLMEYFDIDEIQAEYVSNIKLKHLQREYLINKTNEIIENDMEIKRLNTLFKDRKALANLIIGQLEEIKQVYGENRKSKIIEASDIPTVPSVTEEIDNYNVRIFLTEEGYLKKIPLTSLRGSTTIRVKDGDSISNEFNVTNTSEILVFTDKKNVYKLKAYEINNSKPSDLGEYLPTLLNLQDEEILFSTVTQDFSEKLLIGFDDGRVAKISLSAYETKQNRTVLRNAFADKNALYFNMITDDIDLMSISTDNKVVVLNTQKISEKKSRSTIGVMFMKLREENKVDEFKAIDNEDIEYYRLSSAGVGKYMKKEDSF